MTTKSRVSRLLALGTVGVTGFVSIAHGVSISSNYITVTASSGTNSATLTVPLIDNPFDNLPAVDDFNNVEVLPGIFFTGWDWRNGNSIEVRDPNTNALLLTFVSLGVTAGNASFTNGSPSRYGFDFDFTMVAGPGAVDVQIQTGVLSFASVSSPSGRSDVGVTLTDTSGSAPGASVSGGFAGGTAFHALYNGGSIFRNYLDFSVPFAVGQDQSDAYADNMVPPGSFDGVGADVFSMQVSYSFSLTANDQFSSTGTWVIIPSPGAVAVGFIGLSALSARRRR
ncbi:MAG: hypothetical protein KF768_08575 [Phycisphaeraceae bacterium]|nr:hypothetical protein [Phycisphaeraceae bacterium]